MNEELSQLISLQEIDVEIRRLKEEISSLPSRQRELEIQFSQTAKEYLDLKEQLDVAQNEKRRYESELEIEQQKHQKFKDDLMKATNEREYTTAVREIDVARKAVSSLETEILKLMEKIEKLEANITERTPEMESQRIEVDRQITEWSAAVTANQQRLDELIAQRAPALGALSPNARATYERLSKTRSGLALAEARDWSCLACRMTIRPQVFSDIRRGETIITCESCGRILYFKSETVIT
ncbi:MAG: C4-type zinc ribbon domain-containing protein [Acidobacteria bacterium]|nr:C4-type zinc ribbon domain-containing protein [Acidobacteriota bacterium]